MIEGFRQGLREHGYVEGQNIVVEYRFSEDRNDRLPVLAAELVVMKVQLIQIRATAAVSTTELPSPRGKRIMAKMGRNAERAGAGRAK